MLYNYSIYSSFRLSELFQVFVAGASLDISFVGYIMIFPTLVMIGGAFYKNNITKRVLAIYNVGLLIVLSFLVVIDLEMLKWWGIRSDKTILKYVMQVPDEVLATAVVVPVFSLLAIFLLLSFLSVTGYLKFIAKTTLKQPGISRGWQGVLFVATGALLIIPIRGGVQQIPINQSAVYFSYNNQLNLAAVNLPWNFANSFFARTGDMEKPYKYKPVPDSDKLIRTLYAGAIDTNADKSSFTIKYPNILIVIWESFTYKSITDERNLTPGFNKLKSEGVFFNNIYATGDRSDKGLTGVLSGYPALSRFSIMNEPVKAARITSLSKTLKTRKYSSAFYYGGEPEFANLKSYLLSSGFDRIVTKNDFPGDQQTSKWGVHDHFLYQRLLSDLPRLSPPFFVASFTLSSHEPYDVPVHYIKGKDNEKKFCNSIYYADQSLYNFIEEAKKSAWWDSTVVVVIADHGHIYPGSNNWASRNIDEYHIPMLWTGGAINKPGTVNRLGSQTDLAATLLSQLNIDHSEYPFSKDIFTSQEFAYYAFNNGFGFLLPDQYLVYDNVGDKIIHKSDHLSSRTFRLGKAYQEVTFRDYMDK